MTGSQDADEQWCARDSAARLSMSDLRSELEQLRDRERQIAELLGSKSTDRILHDLRNVLNELQLLRIVASDNNV